MQILTHRYRHSLRVHIKYYDAIIIILLSSFSTSLGFYNWGAIETISYLSTVVHDTLTDVDADIDLASIIILNRQE